MTQQRLYHIGFGKKDLGSASPVAALLCGDPERAQRIAKETNGVSCVATLSENRGLHSYLCQMADGGKFVASTSGMGAPSLSIVVNELVSVGIRTIIRVGTSGGIATDVKAGDLVITADIPLAAEVIEKGGLALNPRGELYSEDNIRQRLNMRDFMDTLRSSGVDTGGPASFSQADRQAFANQLDRLLAK